MSRPRTAGPDQADRLLCLAVSGARSEARDEALRRLFVRLGEPAAWDVSSSNQVGPLVASRLREVGCALTDRWHELLSSNQLRVETLISAAEAVGRELSRAGIPFAVVEGGGTFLASDMPAEAFCPGDLDVLVPQPLEPSLEAARRAGFEGKPADPLMPTMRRVCSNVSGRLIRLEFMSRTFERKWIPVEGLVEEGQWLSRRRASRKTEHLTVLSPEDALINIGLHTSLHSYVQPPGLRLHVDLDRLVRSQEIDWDLFVERARATELPTRIFQSLSMSIGLLGTPIPAEPLLALAPASMRASALQSILARGPLAGRALGKAQRAALEFVLAEHPLLKLWRIAVPPSVWMHERFGTDTPGAHLRRWAAMLRG